MATDKNRRRKRKKFFKLRKGNAWVSTFLFLGLSMLSVAFSLLFLLVFSLIVIDSGIRNEYEAKSLLAELYDEGVSGDEPYLVFDKAGMDYLIKDSDGNILHAAGENTCREDMGFTSLELSGNILSMHVSIGNGSEAPIQLYSDTENDLFSADDEGELTVDFLRLENKMIRSMFGMNSAPLSFPVWEEVKLHGGEQTLLFKTVITLKNSSLAMIAILLAVMVLLILLIFIAMLIHAVTSAINRNRIQQLLFTDIHIKGHNWMWFLFNAEHMLQKRISAKKSYALVDVQFVGYRRFCVCHSVDDGEARLQEIYKYLTRLVNKKEICAHSAEDSFALLLDCDNADYLRKRLNYILSELEHIGNNTFHAGAYIVPAAEKRRLDVDVERDYNRACAACASLDGSDETRSAVYDDKLVEEQLWVDKVENAQQKAVDNEEFLVYYQPKYDPQTNVLRGAEALIRWQSPEYGFLPPYKFIPIFEKNGFITSIDHYMITHAARDQKRWLDEGRRCVPISVNVSRAHFIESDLAEQIRDMVDKEGAPRELIEIELTESAFFDDKKAMLETISRLKSYGFAVSMDDFGSGYSSLNSLKDMPLDVLKLDAEFFRGDAADTKRAEIVVSEAIKLAKSLHMRTVAEGVEARNQVDFLASQGCDMIQGYYFAKPMPAEEFLQRMIAVTSDMA